MSTLSNNSMARNGANSLHTKQWLISYLLNIKLIVNKSIYKQNIEHPQLVILFINV